MQRPSSFSVSSASHVYNVDFLDLSQSAGDWDAVIADRKVPLPETLLGSEIFLDANEQHKTLATVEFLCEQLEARQIKRESKVLVVGGGWTQDISTMAASIFRRGVPWTFAPSTLMSMADSALGGKSSINLKAKKNLLGNFHPPSRIVIDSIFTRTLDTDSLVAGLAEAVKITYARGEDCFERFLVIDAARSLEQSTDYSEVVAEALRAKKWFVEADEFDEGPRRLLNFGHTFAHALESATGMAIQHGNAVLVGMVAAAYLSGNEKLPMTKALLQYSAWLASAVSDELRVAREKLDSGLFREALSADKKGSKSEIVFVLPGRDGRLQLSAWPRNDHTLEEAEEALLKSFTFLLEVAT